VADPVNTGFDPLFGGPLRQLLERARAEGYNPNILSGVRDDNLQAQLVANAAATRAGQPLPYPEHGSVQKAAPVGYSPHEYGTASDISGIPQGELARLASQTGLNTIPGDPGHVELANWRQTAMNQPPPTPWSETNPANVPSRLAMNVGDASAPGGGFAVPGTSLNTTGPDRLSSMVGTLESGGGRYSSAQPASMADPLYGQYPGFVSAYGRGSTGIDNYAQAVLSANPKASVGDFYAGYFSGTGKPGSPNFNNFDLLSKGAIQNTPGTPAAQRAAAQNFIKNAGVDPSAPLTSVVGSPSPSIPGVTGAIDPSIAARQSTTPPTTAPMTAGDWIKKATTPGEGGKASPLSAGIGTLAKAIGGGDDQAQQGQQQAQQAQAQQLQEQQAAAAYGQQRQQALAANASQLMAQIMAQGRKPLSWGSAPPGGAAPGAGAGQLPRLPNAGPSMPDEMLAQLMQQGGSMGMGLNSMGDYNG
jgi:hypothetical protein